MNQQARYRDPDLDRISQAIDRVLELRRVYYQALEEAEALREAYEAKQQGAVQ